MLQIAVQVDGELRDHLPTPPVDGVVRVALELPAGLRDVVQSLGVPHVECGFVAVNGRTTPWQHTVADGDRIVLAPRCPLATPPADPRFLLDDHLGKLARHLRLLGLDAEHRKAVDDAHLVEESVATTRTLLSRDRGLLMRAALRDGRLIRAVDPMEQAVEVVRSFALESVAAPFTRCLECNGLLEVAARHDVVTRVPPSAAARHDRFRECPRCRRIYWEGTHVDRLEARVRTILEDAAR